MFSYSFADLFLLPRFDILLIVLCNCIESFHIETHIGGIGPWPGGLTNYCPSVLDTAGWVMWPVKIVPNMTYNVLVGR